MEEKIIVVIENPRNNINVNELIPYLRDFKIKIIGNFLDVYFCITENWDTFNNV
jgi:hypothetical protein